MKCLLLIWSSPSNCFQDILWIVDFHFCSPPGLARSPQRKSQFIIHSDFTLTFFISNPFFFALPSPQHPLSPWCLSPHPLLLPGCFGWEHAAGAGVVSLGLTMHCWLMWWVDMLGSSLLLPLIFSAGDNTCVSSVLAPSADFTGRLKIKQGLPSLLVAQGNVCMCVQEQDLYSGVQHFYIGSGRYTWLWLDKTLFWLFTNFCGIIQ